MEDEKSERTAAKIDFAAELAFLTAAASGDRKSTADNEALSPIRQREITLKKEHAESMKAWRVNYAAWAAEKRKIERLSKIGFSERKDRLAALGGAPDRPLDWALVSGDPTLEGLIKASLYLHPSHGISLPREECFPAGTR
jgi:Protein of unknown function (DUF3987)